MWERRIKGFFPSRLNSSSLKLLFVFPFTGGAQKIYFFFCIAVHLLWLVLVAFCTKISAWKRSIQYCMPFKHILFTKNRSSHLRRQTVAEVSKKRNWFWLLTIELINVLLTDQIWGNIITLCFPSYPQWRSTYGRISRLFSYHIPAGNTEHFPTHNNVWK